MASYRSFCSCMWIAGARHITNKWHWVFLELEPQANAEQPTQGSLPTVGQTAQGPLENLDLDC